MTSVTCFAILFVAAESVFPLECYNTEMKSTLCHPKLLWCVKWTNGTFLSRGCADVITCPDEEDGCYPEHQKDVESKWCCCNHSLCNGSLSGEMLLYYKCAVIVMWLFVR